MSIGGDATAETSLLGIGLLGRELGLDAHNRIENDASLTRNDFFLANGDNHSFNATLFQMMTSTVSTTSSSSSPIYDRTGLSLFRSQRWAQSQRDNPDFFYGPIGFGLYAAAGFVYELFANGSEAGVGADKETLLSFFGAVPIPGEEGYTVQPERFPPNWYTRTNAYTIPELAAEAVAMYLENPVLFGGNTAEGVFDVVDSDDGLISGGMLKAGISEDEVACLLYQVIATQAIPV
ncbi:hypothetical protein SISNIDRAFT_457471, partial [Sistotremastrum niveocremeum HHB9708]